MSGDPLDMLGSFDALAGAGEHRRGGGLARYAVLDVFTDVALAGNQLAVFPDARAIPEAAMQPLARELGLSETVFVGPPTRGGDVSARIFTPGHELPFAGHPVLGTAILVGNALGIDEVAVETLSGNVPVRLRREDGVCVSGWMRQPIPTWAPYEQARELLGALGAQRAELPVEVYVNGPRHVLVELSSERDVVALAPDLRALEALGGICVSCFAGAGRHWKTRMFAPSEGVPEDPATGSAAGPLAVHLSRHGRISFGAEIEIRQGAEIGRPSLLYAFARGSADDVREVAVGGSAVTVATGSHVVPADTLSR